MYGLPFYNLYIDTEKEKTKSMPETYQVLSDRKNNIDSSVSYKLIHRYEMRLILVRKSWTDAS